MQTQLLHVAIADLHYGQDHPDIAVNIRKTERTARIEELIASLKAEGLLQPILVWVDGADQRQWVVDGSRRLFGIRQIIEEGGNPNIDNDEVPALVLSECTAEEALQKSIAGFSTTLPPHPMDQFEAFAAIRALPKNLPITTDGVVEDIAMRYGITPGLVRRRLALGALAPEIRDAFREDKIDLKTAAAFTLQRDQAAQIVIFNKLKKKGLSPWSVRSEIMGDARDTPAMLKLVTVEEYEKAGGEVFHDLFSEKEGAGDGVSDQALLKKLADTMIRQKCESVVGEGWQFCYTTEDLPPGWAHIWTRNHLKKTKTPEADRAKMGAIVTLNDNGSLEVEYGVVKPAEGKTEKTKAAAKKKPAADDAAGSESEPALSQNVVRALQRQATIAMARAVLSAQPNVALAALLAAIAAGGKGPVSITAAGLETRESGVSTDTAEFWKTFNSLLKKGSVGLKAATAQAVCAALDLVVVGDPEPFADQDVETLAAELPPKVLNEALRKAFDPKLYFENVSKAFLFTAITEAMGADTFEKVSKGSKAELAKYAVANVAKTGWLPVELRSPHYDGPGSSVKKKAKAR